MNWFFSEINVEDNIISDLDIFLKKFSSKQIISLNLQRNEITSASDEILSSCMYNLSCISSLQINISASKNNQIIWR